MKRLIAFLFVIISLLLCGCGERSPIDNASESVVTVNIPTDDSVNGYRIEKETVSSQSNSSVLQSSQAGDIIYYANTNSKKFHLSTCGTGKRTKQENLYVTEDRAELINDGFTPCKSCNP